MKKALFLRTCNAQMQGYNGFQWPDVGGEVSAPDWNPEPICGYGLHGLLWGIGSEQYLDRSESAKGIVFEADEDSAVWIEGNKVKVPKARVVFVGTLNEAARWLDERKPSPDRAGYRGTATAGDDGTATAGYCGTATAGDDGTATAGYRGTAKAGDDGTATAGYCGTATAGDDGTATAGYRGTAKAGDRGTAKAGNYGTATAGNCGTATAGDDGTATAGYRGTATAGYRGTAKAGYRGTATAGYGGILSILHWTGERYRFSVARVQDEDGDGELEPNVPYRLDEHGNFVVAETAEARDE